MDRTDGRTEETLAQRIVAAPVLLASDRMQARLDDWLADIAGTPAGTILPRLLVEHPRLNALLVGIAEGSPYLWDLARADPARLAVLLESDPDRRLVDILADATRAVGATADDAEAMRLLRRMKSEAALLIALADIGGVWPVMRVTAALTDLADTAVCAAVRYLVDGAVRQGRLRPRDRDRPELGSGYVVLAMVKMGARELNYSSDIDLIVFHDAAAANLSPEIEPAPFYVRLTRALVKLLQERTADGYVFRID